MAILFDIERGSMHDGPGLRTVVFFKGCPLRCRWCHNPESRSFTPQTLFYPERCIGCGQCAEGCYTDARRLCGTEMTVEQVMAPILADKSYYGTEGGVTLSGGEPQCQADFARELVRACHKEGISVAIETSMAVFQPDLLRELDLIIADIKVWDPQRHQEYVGMDNALILDRIRQADRWGIPLILHTPVIPTVNDTEEEITAIRDFVRTLRHAVAYELLPYHPLGEDKQRALGQEPVRFPTPTAEKMAQLRRCAVL